MSKHIVRWIIERRLPLLCTSGVAILGLCIGASLLVEPSTPVLRMSAGPDSTRRHTVAVYLSEQASRNGLDIKLVPNTGSEECLDLLKTRQLDVAIVSNGVLVRNDDNITVLGAIQMETVHVLVRKELADRSLPESIRGRRVNLGEKGSTEWLLAHDLLSFAHLRLPSESEPGDILTTEYSKAYLTEKAHAILRSEVAKKDALIAEMPDCLIVVASMPSTLVQSLVEAADYRVVPLPLARTFLLDNLQDDKSRSAIVDRQFLERTVVPSNSYFTTRGYPEADCETVGMRLLIVARKDADGRAIKLLMKTVFERDFAHTVQPRSPRDVASPYEIHPAAIAYLDRDKPLAIKEAIDWISRGFSVFGIISAGGLSLYGLLWRKKVRKPTDYFAEIRKVELLAQGMQADATAPVQPRELARCLDDRIVKLRQDLIEDICEGRMKNDQVIANILMLLKDTRRNLAILEEDLNHPGPSWHAGKPATNAA